MQNAPQARGLSSMRTKTKRLPLSAMDMHYMHSRTSRRLHTMQMRKSLSASRTDSEHSCWSRGARHRKRKAPHQPPLQFAWPRRRPPCASRGRLHATPQQTLGHVHVQPMRSAAADELASQALLLSVASRRPEKPASFDRGAKASTSAPSIARSLQHRDLGLMRGVHVAQVQEPSRRQSRLRRPSPTPHSQDDYPPSLLLPRLLEHAVDFAHGTRCEDRHLALRAGLDVAAMATKAADKATNRTTDAID